MPPIYKRQGREKRKTHPRPIWRHTGTNSLCSLSISTEQAHLSWKEHLCNLFHVNLCCRLGHSHVTWGHRPEKTKSSRREIKSTTIGSRQFNWPRLLFLQFFLLTAVYFPMVNDTSCNGNHFSRRSAWSRKSHLFGNYQQAPALFHSFFLFVFLFYFFSRRAKDKAEKVEKAYITCLLLLTHTHAHRRLTVDWLRNNYQ